MVANLLVPQIHHNFMLLCFSGTWQQYMLVRELVNLVKAQTETAVSRPVGQTNRMIIRRTEASVWLAGKCTVMGKEPGSATSSIYVRGKKTTDMPFIVRSWRICECINTRYSNVINKLITHIRRHLSFPPLATRWPSGLQSTANTWMKHWHKVALKKLYYYHQ